mgnify:CR=1 FL=1
MQNKTVTEIYNLQPVQCPLVTNVQDNECRETKAIVDAIDEALFYNGLKTSATPVAKPKDVISVLIQILVSNGLLTLPQVQRALNTNTTQGGD